MQRIAIVLAMSALGAAQALAQPVPLTPDYYAAQPATAPMPPRQIAYREQRNLGGGFIEFLFGGGEARGQQPPMVVRAEPPVMRSTAEPPLLQEPGQPQQAPAGYAHADPADGTPARPAADPRYMKQVVDYDGPEKPGTIIIDTPKRFLFLVQEGGKAIRYGIGVGRPGFTWAGVKTISAKREWPDWRPPEEMLQRRPDLPRYMAGGPENPLGARAMYLGSSLYRIHGSNEPWTIGQAVSSGCIRMRNEDVVDLYDRVKVGTKVIVI
ncbi:MAG TPA: L,D-transpeptidase [Pseudorhodoplanes sp.]|nr:L,D-transpeptidase [Pseudorhodoplanes sp.]